MFHNQVYYERRITVRMDRNAEKEKNKFKEMKLPSGLQALGPGLGDYGLPFTEMSSKYFHIIPC